MKINRILGFVAAIMIGTVSSQVRRLIFYSCEDGSPLEGSAGPCLDTPGCELPLCCGIIAAKGINVSFTYRAQADALGGTFKGYIDELTPSTNTADPLSSLSIKLLAIPAPYPLAAYNSDMCYVGPNKPFNPDFCPQTAGNYYTFNQVMSFPIQFITSATLVAGIKGIISSGPNIVTCVRAYGRVFAEPLMTLLPGIG